LMFFCCGCCLSGRLFFEGYCGFGGGCGEVTKAITTIEIPHFCFVLFFYLVTEN